MKQQTIDRIRQFTLDRDWEQFHTPANLAKSISIEANELLECFQWNDDDYDIQAVREELADVLVYCRNMLDRLGLDEDEIGAESASVGGWAAEMLGHIPAAGDSFFCGGARVTVDRMDDQRVAWVTVAREGVPSDPKE